MIKENFKNGLKLVAEATARSYSSIIFMDGAGFGGAILLVTFINPALGFGGLIGALTANIAAMLFGYPRELVRSGMYGISALLVGLALAFFKGQPLVTYLIIVPAALLTMTLQTLIADRLYKSFRIGALSLPFAMIATVTTIDPALLHGSFTIPHHISEMALGESFFRSLGAIFFMPDPWVGAFFFSLLLLYSRVLAVLAFLGFALGTTMYEFFGGEVADVSFGMVGLNFILTAMAVGGVYLLPGIIATIHALLAVSVTALASLVVHRVFSEMGLPVFSWPFNIATLCWLAALSLRPSETSPKSTWGLSGAPETMLARRQMLDRIGLGEPCPRLPVIGEWTVTQAIGGTPTHQPPWAHAWDFEVMDAAGFPFRIHDGSAVPSLALEDYYSFGAPVIAVADGVVVLVVSGIFDNTPGDFNTKDNFGNQVIIRHSEKLYSVYAHLRHGSVRVWEGQIVRAGDVIAQCGSSGRSPRPHLHFHFQADAVVGSATLPMKFSQFIGRKGDETRFHESGQPEVFERVTSLHSLKFSHPAPKFEAGGHWTFSVERGGETSIETWKSDVDLWGRIRVTSDMPRAVAIWNVDSRGMTAVSFEGSRNGALYAAFAGCSRIPSRVAAEIQWSDDLSAEYSAGTMMRPIAGALLPLMVIPSGRTHFSFERLQDSVITARNGARTIETRWSNESVLREIRVHRRGKTLLTARLQ